MRVRLIRKHYPNLWQSFSRLALVTLTVQALWLLSVKCALAATSVSYLTVEPASGFDATRVYAGRTVAGRASELGFRHAGEIERVHVDIGDTVASGDLLAKLDTDSLEALEAQALADVSLAAANLKAVEAETQLARQTEARFRSLRDSGHTSAQLYDEQRLALQAKEAQLSVAAASLTRAEANARAARIAVEDAHIYAPFAGQIQSRHMDEGAQTRPGQTLFRLVETAHREAHVGIPESMLDTLKPEGQYNLRWADSRLVGTVQAVLPEVDPESRTVTVVLALEDETVPFGAVVELELNHRVANPGYWIPLTALTESDRGLWGAYVVNEESSAERRLVEILHVEAERAFVRGTLNPGDRVISTGVQRIVPGQAVTMAGGL
ncbi:MAG: efflux RND transporter periplasmic adaptor subunit [Pseudomonadota bacterium]